MTTRRSFLTTLLAASAMPTLSWADAGNPRYLAAAREPDGGYALFGLNALGQDTFRVPLPARGHAAAGHPHKPLAVAFARRPGTYALVIDCADGHVLHQLTLPERRRFNGHGAFSAGGDVLYTSEIDAASGQGVIGVWDAMSGYRRTGEWSSQGIGPHEIARLPGSGDLVVANGGIRTAMDDERSKLNLDTMAPNLSYFSADGELLDQISLPPELHQNSIRHLALRSDGLVSFAMQTEDPDGWFTPLLGLHRRGAPLVLAAATEPQQMRMKGYAGSIAFSGNGAQVALTSPHGGVLSLFDAAGQFQGMMARTDVSGVGPAEGGFMTTDGLGGLCSIAGDALSPLNSAPRAWDNHLVTLPV
ncbi:DUF1513 domain-containing protein [Puniceibacterium sediminis]|uniref:Twin-arginine translocation pathway signal n=1 Tax=Puniceibacterium sediminis TaxID=1608407 RepID=A0A238V0L8_9RHOB|nr:DUF1513 domain-containing protein [Puniceibacterium sediminis]SNR27985.1 hypothetical protein SAMN06265370_101457 [Puniceibacterium sediminis]